MSRIFDQPNHPHYGPVRRMHIMIMQLFTPYQLSVLDSHYHEEYNENWDDQLSRLMSWDPCEPINSRDILSRVLTLPTI